MSTPISDRKLSERKLHANRSNAQKSTGPKTPEGKAISSQNATSHGLFTDACLMPGEDAFDFLGFRHGILASLHPNDPAQLMLADKVVSAQWRLKRLRQAEQVLYASRAKDLREAAEEHDAQVECFNQDWRELTGHDLLPPQERHPDPEPPLAAQGILATFLASDDAHDPFDRLCRYEQRLELTLHRALRDYRQLKLDQNTYLTDDLPAYIPDLPDLPQVPAPTDHQVEPIEPDEPDEQYDDEEPDEQDQAQKPTPAPQSAPESSKMSPPTPPGKNEPTDSDPHVITYSRNHAPAPFPPDTRRTCAREKPLQTPHAKEMSGADLP